MEKEIGYTARPTQKLEEKKEIQSPGVIVPFSIAVEWRVGGTGVDPSCFFFLFTF